MYDDVTLHCHRRTHALANALTYTLAHALS